MSSVNAPFGLQPLFHLSGDIVPVQALIANGYTSNIFQNSPVKYGADAAQGFIILAPTNETLIGTFQGCKYTDANGRYNVSNKWLANTVSTDATATITADPAIVYSIQGTGSIAATAVGMQADYSTNNTSSGSLGTGLSNVTVGTFSASVAAALRCVGLNTAVNNEWGDAFTVVQVQIAEHQNVNPIGPY